jgi:hypothetical protein
VKKDGKLERVIYTDTPGPNNKAYWIWNVYDIQSLIEASNRNPNNTAGSTLVEILKDVNAGHLPLSVFDPLMAIKANNKDLGLRTPEALAMAINEAYLLTLIDKEIEKKGGRDLTAAEEAKIRRNHTLITNPEKFGLPPRQQGVPMVSNNRHGGGGGGAAQQLAYSPDGPPLSGDMLDDHVPPTTKVTGGKHVASMDDVATAPAPSKEPTSKDKGALIA